MFGYSVDIDADGDTIVVGAPHDSSIATNAGAAYVFGRTAAGWVEQAKIALSDARSSEYLGLDVAISGDRIAASAPGDLVPPGSYFDFGTVVVFEGTGMQWTEVTRVHGSFAVLPNFFGISIALDGDVLGVVDNYSFFGLNRVHAFELSGSGTGTTWTQVLEVVEDGVESVGVSGDTLVVGNPYDSSAGIAQHGSVTVYRRNGASWFWAEEARLVNDDAVAIDRIGFSVDIDGDTVVTGPRMGHPEPQAVLVWERAGTEWSLAAKLQSSVTAASSVNFGVAVATSGGRVLVGDRSDGQGSASVYESAVGFGTSFCFGDGLGTACPCWNDDPLGPGGGCASSVGEGAVLALGGSASVSQNQLVVSAWSVPDGIVALFAGTTAHAGGSGTPFGDGLRCVGGALQNLGTAPPGLPRLWTPDFGALGWTAGSTVTLQALYRDPSGPCGTTLNTTGAYELSLVP